jgi:hypothetical protein
MKVHVNKYNKNIHMLIIMLIFFINKSYPQYKYVPFFTLLTWYKSNILAKNRYKQISNREKVNKLCTI